MGALAQPAGASGIDWGHPAARDLVLASTGSAPVNFCDGTVMRPLAARAPLLKASPEGAWIASSGGDSFLKDSSSPGRFSAPEFTIFSLFNPFTSSASVRNALSAIRVAGTVSWTLRIDAASTFSFVVWDNVAGAWRTATTAAASVGSRCAVFAQRTAARVDIWLNGVNSNTVASNTIYATDAMNLYGTESWSGQMSTPNPLILLWNRLLTNQMRADISENPWQVFR